MLAALAAGVALHRGPAAAAATTLDVFVGARDARERVIERLLDGYQRNHDVRVRLVTGAATSESQRRYLTTVLAAEDGAFDVMLIDVVNPAEYAAAGWLEPLDGHLSAEARRGLGDFLPPYRDADRVNGHWVALPANCDALFLYYRRDLLAKYHLAVPRTWLELAGEARRILAGEGNPNLSGLSIAGAPIEGTVCTFLLPYFSAGGHAAATAGGLELDPALTRRTLIFWADMAGGGLLDPDAGEIKTGDTVEEFAARQAVFAINWGFAFSVFERDPASLVRGRTGMAGPPAVSGGQAVTCLGGWQWAVSAASRHKAEATALVEFLSSREVARALALQAGLLPARRSLYADAAIRRALPWMQAALPVLNGAVPRPRTPYYGEVSDVLRSTTSAVLAGAAAPAEEADAISAELGRL